MREMHSRFFEKRRNKNVAPREPLFVPKQVAFGDDHGQPLPDGGTWHLPKPACE